MFLATHWKRPASSRCARGMRRLPELRKNHLLNLTGWSLNSHVITFGRGVPTAVQGRRISWFSATIVSSFINCSNCGRSVTTTMWKQFVLLDFIQNAIVKAKGQNLEKLVILQHQCLCSCQNMTREAWNQNQNHWKCEFKSWVSTKFLTLIFKPLQL